MTRNRLLRMDGSGTTVSIGKQHGLALAGFVAAREFGFGFHTRHLWSAILATVLVVPLYYLRKNIERRLDEARYQLEQIGPPEPSEETGTSHTT